MKIFKPQISLKYFLALSLLIPAFIGLSYRYWSAAFVRHAFSHVSIDKDVTLNVFWKVRRNNTAVPLYCFIKINELPQYEMSGGWDSNSLWIEDFIPSKNRSDSTRYMPNGIIYGETEYLSGSQMPSIWLQQSPDQIYFSNDPLSPPRRVDQGVSQVQLMGLGLIDMQMLSFINSSYFKEEIIPQIELEKNKWQIAQSYRPSPAEIQAGRKLSRDAQ